MMSRYVVQNWNLEHQQRQEQVEAAQEANTSHNNNNNNNSHLCPMSSDYDVAELKWENGELAMHGLGVVSELIPTKLTWGGGGGGGGGRSNDTLESIVHQATVTCQDNNNGDNRNKETIALNLLQRDQNSPAKMSSNNMVASSGGGKCPESSCRVPVLPELLTPADYSGQFGRNFSACATFCRDTNTTMMTRASTRASHQSPINKSLMTKTTDEDSAGHGVSENQDDDHETKTGRSHSSKRSRVAAIHNQSERRRRDRINQKMKALQRLVPNASKTDKASMLEEVIAYLKQLQAQVQMMSNVRNNNMPQMNMMMMPLGLQQQQLQMSLLLARMGMGVDHLGMGMGMYDMNTMAAAASTAAARSVPQSLNPLIHLTGGAPVSPFIVPSMIATCPPSKENSDPGRDTNNASSVPLPDPYCAFLAQSMNVESYNKMTELFRQQVNQNSQKEKCSPHTQSNNMQRG